MTVLAGTWQQNQQSIHPVLSSFLLYLSLNNSLASKHAKHWLMKTDWKLGSAGLSWAWGLDPAMEPDSIRQKHSQPKQLRKHVGLDVSWQKKLLAWRCLRSFSQLSSLQGLSVAHHCYYDDSHAAADLEDSRTRCPRTECSKGCQIKMPKWQMAFKSGFIRILSCSFIIYLCRSLLRRLGFGLRNPGQAIKIFKVWQM